ncbi:hypothetical protein LINPERHAP2_LOCUS3580, partial [Linum perenne]
SIIQIQNPITKVKYKTKVHFQIQAQNQLIQNIPTQNSQQNQNMVNSWSKPSRISSTPTSHRHSTHKETPELYSLSLTTRT